MSWTLNGVTGEDITKCRAACNLSFDQLKLLIDINLLEGDKESFLENAELLRIKKEIKEEECTEH